MGASLQFLRVLRLYLFTMPTYYVPMLHLISLKTVSGAPSSGGHQVALRTRLSHPHTWAMWGSQSYFWHGSSAGSVMHGTEHVYWAGCRVCAIRALVQQMYQPFQDCCTYWAIYRTAYRPGPASTRLRSACRPGWKRTSRLPRVRGAAMCQSPCQNGGSYV